MNYSVLNTLPIGQLRVGMNQSMPAYRPIRTGRDNISVNRELDRLLDKRVLTDMVNTNPVVLSILKNNNLKPVINVENFKRTTYAHSVDTKNTATGIYNFLPTDLKSQANLQYIQKGAMLHDLGKVLIPEKIMNKRGRLNEEEARIMHLHSKLSDALLSTQNIEPEVLNIVKYHHQNRRGTGYPEIKNTLNGFDINTEIVSLADKFSALTENRSYKTSMSAEDAMAIIRQDVEEGNINPRVYNALVGYINSGKTAKVAVNK
ncbi:MAG: HD domain-containing protein [Cyanobacteria bacterium RUI128]|nr:HD domain-containing protein [Cyanobacteria bacterium RUI128]